MSPLQFHRRAGEPKSNVMHTTVNANPVHRKAGIYISRKFRWLIDHMQKRWFSAVGGKRYVRALRGQTPTAPFSGRLYIDISVISRNDAATGIQRVVRSVAFLLAEFKGQDVVQPTFVYTYKNRHYVVRLEDGDYIHTDELVNYTAGDIFVGLDYALDALWRMRHELARMRQKEVRFWYVVHDFLPLTNPAWFSHPTVLRFRNWLAIIAATADGFFCVSPPVEQQLRSILNSRFGLESGYRTVVIPMGWDLATSNPSTGLPNDFEFVKERLRAAPSVLIVGTIEPRKGHEDALAAMELLWKRGIDANIVLVGGIGWKTEALCARLENHKEAKRRLFLMGKVSDEALEHLYMSCSGVLVPSLAEGFGLPVVEAIGHGKRVLARNLAVFAQHTGKGVTYFNTNADPTELADAIYDWLTNMEKLDPPRLDLLETWQDTADIIYRSVLDP